MAIKRYIAMHINCMYDYVNYMHMKKNVVIIIMWHCRLIDSLIVYVFNTTMEYIIMYS